MTATLSMTSIRRAALLVALTFTFAVAASAETLLMPKRDGAKGQPLVVWFVTTSANGSAFTINFGDGTSTNGTVSDRSYMPFTKTYTALLPGEASRTFTVTLTIGAETATTEVRILDPTLLPGGVNGEAARGLKINMAIENGLRYLWRSQANRAANFPNVTTTSWTQGAGWPQQWTALVALAFQNHGYRLPADLSAPTGIYEKYVVRRALNHVIANLVTVQTAVQGGNTGFVPQQPVRDPCVGLVGKPDPCMGLRPSSADPGYATGIAMMPLAGSGVLNKVNTEVTGYTNGKTYKEILQRLANALSWGQSDGNGNGRGGWIYDFNSGGQEFDGSTVGWALLGLMDAAAAGVIVPQWVRDEFGVGLTRALNNNGSLDYRGDGNPALRTNPNIEKAGTGLQGMFFIGEIGSARANLTKGYISDRWNSGRIGAEENTWGCGGLAIPNRGCGYAMFNNFKGLKLQGIITLPGVTRAAGPGDIPAGDWYADYQDWLVANQTNPNAIDGGNWAGMVFSPIANSLDATAALAELILSPVALVLPDGDKFATVGLSPATHSAFELTSHTVTAHAQSASTPENPDGTPVAGATVNFAVLSGPNTGVTGSAITNLAGNATFTYTDAGPVGTFGQDRIRANIGALVSNIAEMNWISLNRAPVANDNSYTTPEDSPLTGNVVIDPPADTDADGDVLTAILVTSPTKGVFGFAPNGAFSYTPNPNDCSPDSFSYKLNDGEVDGNVAIVSINVACVNDAPTAGDDSASTNEDTPVNGSVTANDGDVDSALLSWSKASDPANGTVTVNGDGTYTYTPAPDYCGPDSFTYQVSDGALTATATVSLTVGCVNDAPAAGDDSASTDEDTPLNGSVSANDGDADSALLTWSKASDPANGTVVVNGDGTYTYTPNANYCGNDAFNYQVSDGSLTDTATVAITVTCVNDAPTADDDSASTNEDTPLNGSVTANDADADSALLSWSKASDPANGTVVVNGDGTYTYTPNANYCGNDAFNYQVSDGSLTDTATVAITVNCANDPPVADDGAAATNEDSAVSGQLTSSDTDGGAPSYSAGSGPAHGSVVVNPDGSFTYTPTANFCGSDAFTFEVTDGTATDSGSVSVTVNCVNDAPVANDSSVTTSEDTPLAGTATSSDIDGPGAAYAVATGPAHGSVTLNPDGTYIYTPALNYNGPDSFTFTVNDGDGGSDTGAVSIDVAPVNDAPFCSAAGPSIASLWPANHELVDINVLGVTDPVENSAITIEVTGIFQDEPTNTIGDGNTLIDGFGLGTSIATLRRERSGSKRVPGDGRMYYINFTGTDADGGQCTGTVQVGVPHDLGQDNAIGAGGPLYKSTGQ